MNDSEAGAFFSDNCPHVNKGDGQVTAIRGERGLYSLHCLETSLQSLLT